MRTMLKEDAIKLKEECKGLKNEYEILIRQIKKQRYDLASLCSSRDEIQFRLIKINDILFDSYFD